MRLYSGEILRRWERFTSKTFTTGITEDTGTSNLPHVTSSIEHSFSLLKSLRNESIRPRWPFYKETFDHSGASLESRFF